MGKIFVEKDSQPLGPFSESEIRHNVAIGTLDPNDTAWRSDENVRGSLKDIVNLDAARSENTTKPDADSSESTTKPDYAPLIKIIVVAVIVSAVIIAIGGWMNPFL